MAQALKGIRPAKDSNFWVRGEVTGISHWVESKNFTPKLKVSGMTKKDVLESPLQIHILDI